MRLIRLLLLIAVPALVTAQEAGLREADCAYLARFRDGYLAQQFDQFARKAEELYTFNDAQLQDLYRVRMEFVAERNQNKRRHLVAQLVRVYDYAYAAYKMIPVWGSMLSFVECFDKALDSGIQGDHSSNLKAWDCTVVQGANVALDMAGLALVTLPFELVEFHKEISKAEQDYRNKRYENRQERERIARKIDDLGRYLDRFRNTLKQKLQVMNRFEFANRLRAKIDKACGSGATVVPNPIPPGTPGSDAPGTSSFPASKPPRIVKPEHRCTIADQYVSVVGVKRGQSCGDPTSISVKVVNNAPIPLMVQLCLEKRSKKTGKILWDCGLDSKVDPGEEWSYWCCRATGNFRHRARVLGDYMNGCLPKEKGTNRPIKLPPEKIGADCSPHVLNPCWKSLQGTAFQPGQAPQVNPPIRVNPPNRVRLPVTTIPRSPGGPVLQQRGWGRR